MEQRFGVARERLQRVAEGVAEIEQRTGAGFALVGARRCAALARQLRAIACCRGAGVAREQRRGRCASSQAKKPASPIRPYFDHLGVARAQLAARQGRRARRCRPAPVAAGGRRRSGSCPARALIPVLPPTELSTWASSVVGICTKSMPRRRIAAAKPGEVADHPAAEGDQRGPALGSEVQQLIQKPLEPGRRSWSPRLPAPRSGAPRCRRRRGSLPGPADEPSRRDWHRSRRSRRAAEQRPEFRAGATEQARPDRDVVAARAQLDPEAGRRGHGGSPMRSPASASRMRSTTAPIGPLLLSTTRSASA